MVVARSLAGFQGRASLKTWLLTITAHTAKTRLKHNRREVLLDDQPAPHGTVGDERFSVAHALNWGAKPVKALLHRASKPRDFLPRPGLGA